MPTGSPGAAKRGPEADLAATPGFLDGRPQSSLSMATFVTGGSGFVGRHLLRALDDRAGAVRALARSASSAETVRELGAEPVEGDLGAVDAMAEGMRDCDVAFHVAAKTDEWGSREAFERVNVRGTELVLEAARRAGVDRLVYVSTEAVVVDGSAHREIDETQPFPDRHVTRYGETKAHAEQLVRAADGDDLTTVAVRPPTVWGPDDTSVGAKIAAAVEDGRFAWIDGGRYPVATGHVENVVEGLLLAAEAEGVGGEAYFVTDGDPVEFRSFISDLLEARGLTPGDRSVPRPVARALARGGDWLWRRLGLSGAPPITRSYVYLFGLPMTIDDSKAREALGYEPAVSRDEGLEALRDASAAG